MIPIQKTQEPEELRALRERTLDYGLSPERAFAQLKNPLKDQVRVQLLQEQGHLCAYCMCAIPRGDLPEGIYPFVIEHIYPRNPMDYGDCGQGLDYQNLVLTCHGNKGTRGSKSFPDWTCDQRKQNHCLEKINPCIPETLQSIYYTLDGKILATDPKVQKDLTTVLNLNSQSSPLPAEREAALNSLIDTIESILQLEPETAFVECQEILQAFQRETEKKTPYVGILIWYLQDFLSAISK